MDAKKTGAFLASLRRERQLIQQDAADALGLSNKTVSKWESGGGFPDITLLPALAELYGVTVDELLAGERLNSSAQASRAPEFREQKRLLRSRIELRFWAGATVSAAAALAALALRDIEMWAAVLCGVVSVTALALSWIFTVVPLHGADELKPDLLLKLFRGSLLPGALLWGVLLWYLGRVALSNPLYALLSWMGKWTRSDWNTLPILALFWLTLPLFYLAVQLVCRCVSGQREPLLPRRVIAAYFIFLALWLAASCWYFRVDAAFGERLGEVQSPYLTTRLQKQRFAALELPGRCRIAVEIAWPLVMAALALWSKWPLPVTKADSKSE